MVNSGYGMSCFIHMASGRRQDLRDHEEPQEHLHDQGDVAEDLDVGVAEDAQRADRRGAHHADDGAEHEGDDPAEQTGGKRPERPAPQPLPVEAVTGGDRLPEYPQFQL